MHLGLEGKVALVTGGRDGIGRATAHALAREGAKVAIVARRPDVLGEAADAITAATRGDVLAVPADVSTADGVDAAFRVTLERFGRLDALVNNAGTSRALPFES